MKKTLKRLNFFRWILLLYPLVVFSLFVLFAEVLNMVDYTVSMLLAPAIIVLALLFALNFLYFLCTFFLKKDIWTRRKILFTSISSLIFGIAAIGFALYFAIVYVPEFVSNSMEEYEYIGLEYIGLPVEEALASTTYISFSAPILLLPLISLILLISSRRTKPVVAEHKLEKANKKAEKIAKAEAKKEQRALDAANKKAELEAKKAEEAIRKEELELQRKEKEAALAIERKEKEAAMAIEKENKAVAMEEKKKEAAERALELSAVMKEERAAKKEEKAAKKEAAAITVENFLPRFENNIFNTLRKIFIWLVVITNIAFWLSVVVYEMSFRHFDLSLFVHEYFFMINIVFKEANPMFGIVSVIGLTAPLFILAYLTFFVISHIRRGKMLSFYKEHAAEIGDPGNVNSYPKEYRKIAKAYVETNGFFFTSKSGKIKSLYLRTAWIYLVALFGGPVIISIIAGAILSVLEIEGLDSLVFPILSITLGIFYLEETVTRFTNHAFLSVIKTGRVEGTDAKFDWDENMISFCKADEKLKKRADKISKKDTYLKYFFSSVKDAILIGIPFIYIVVAIAIVVAIFKFIIGLLADKMGVDVNLGSSSKQNTQATASSTSESTLTFDDFNSSYDYEMWLEDGAYGGRYEVSKGGFFDADGVSYRISSASGTATIWVGSTEIAKLQDDGTVFMCSLPPSSGDEESSGGGVVIKQFTRWYIKKKYE